MTQERSTKRLRQGPEAPGGVPLQSTTTERWTDCALSELDRLLDDHCQCELKAASNALALVGRNPDREELVQAMAALAREEMLHYRQVRKILISRRARLSRPAPNPYLKGLQQLRLGGEWALLDELVVAALVEARSCERFESLAHGLRSGAGRPDRSEREADSLAAFYEGLARSESGHATLFADLARRYYPAELVDRELRRRSGIEAELLVRLPIVPRMHGGHGVD
jgi:tRNA-(ms[2]io[6]A)-hydroxylase